MQHRPDISSEIRSEIDRRLAAIVAEEGVQLLMAVESGSRAWGFPSPDSDYDVRFLYVRPRADYLALSPPRDVIERPIVDEIDLNGWDIRKALGLLLKHNAVLSEWIESPIRYVPDHPVMAELNALASAHFNPRGYARHYASLVRSTMSRWFDEHGKIAVKRYFYALRPALSIRALRLAPKLRPPMNMRPLMQAAQVDSALAAQIDELIARKAETKEASNAIRLPEVEALIEAELERVEEIAERRDEDGFQTAAEALFLRLVDEQ